MTLGRCTTCKKMYRRDGRACPYCPPTKTAEQPGISGLLRHLPGVSNERVREWFEVRPDALAAVDENLSSLLGRVRKYGITLERWATMIATSNSTCAICGKAFPPLALHIDHDHTFGNVRGLLCVRCNTGLGTLGIDGHDSLPRLDSIRRYLTRRTPLVVDRKVNDQRVGAEQILACIARGERLF